MAKRSGLQRPIEAIFAKSVMPEEVRTPAQVRTGQAVKKASTERARPAKKRSTRPRRLQVQDPLPLESEPPLDLRQRLVLCLVSLWQRICGHGQG